MGYGKLVIATGATPVLPPVPGRDLNGVMTFITANDLRRIMEQVDNGLKKAVVVGAGVIGIELVQGLQENWNLLRLPKQESGP